MLILAFITVLLVRRPDVGAACELWHRYVDTAYAGRRNV